MAAKKNMIRKAVYQWSVVFLFVAALFMMCRTTTYANRFYGGRVYNCKKYVTLRKKASSSSKALKKVKYGAKVEWCYGDGEKNGYYKVIYNGKKGWIKAKYLNFDYDWNGCFCLPAKIVGAKKIVLYKGKSSSSKKLARIKRGELTFIYEEPANNGQGKYTLVNYRGKNGYVKTKYLEEID